MTKPGDSPTSKGTCITAEMRKDRTPLEAMKRRAQEAEGELTILKGIETNRVKEAQAKSSQLQDEVDKVSKEKKGTTAPGQSGGYEHAGIVTKSIPPTRVPTSSMIKVLVQPVYSRNKIKQ